VLTSTTPTTHVDAQLQTILDDLLKDAPIDEYESCATPAFVAPFADASDGEPTASVGQSLDTFETATTSDDDGLLARLIDECDLILEEGIDGASSSSDSNSRESKEESVHDCDILLDADLLDSSLFIQSPSHKLEFSINDYSSSQHSTSNIDIPVWDQSMKQLFDFE